MSRNRNLTTFLQTEVQSGRENLSHKGVELGTPVKDCRENPTCSLLSRDFEDLRLKRRRFRGKSERKGKRFRRLLNLLSHYVGN